MYAGRDERRERLGKEGRAGKKEKGRGGGTDVRGRGEVRSREGGKGSGWM